MNKEEDNLLFLSQLYNTWPWYDDRETIIGLQGKIINMQHRQLTQIHRQEDIKNKTKKRKKRKSQKFLKEFPPEIIEPHNVK